jgi:hypothetical protein
MTRAIEYLGRASGELLNAEPFSEWQVVRTVENEPKREIWYEFEGRGVEVICDGSDRVQTIFLHRGGDGESLFDIPFVMTRKQVQTLFGEPAKSGGAVRIPGLGDRGAWDRFALSMGTVHVQYTVERDEIDMVTLIRGDAVP